MRSGLLRAEALDVDTLAKPLARRAAKGAEALEEAAQEAHPQGGEHRSTDGRAIRRSFQGLEGVSGEVYGF